MNKLDEKIKNYINDRKSKRIYRVTAVILSVVVLLSVTASLILPAISATQSPDLSVATYSDTVDFSDFDTDKNAFNLEKYITNLTFENGVADANGNTITGSLSLTYNVNDSAVLPVLSTDEPYLYITLPENVTVAETMTGYITDGSDKVGEYIIEPGTNLVKIKIYDDYFDKYKYGFSGTLSFQSQVTRLDTETGSTTDVKIGTQTVVIEGFTPKKTALSKSGTNNGDGTITWTIIVDNPNAEDLGSFTLSDTMFDAKRAENVSVDPVGAGSYDSETGEFTFTSGATDKQVTITYTTTLTDEETWTPKHDWGDGDNWMGKITNTVSLINSDNSVDLSDNTTVYYDLGYAISKEGNANYTDGTIDWKITITNKYNRSLNGFKIKDSMFSEYFTDASNITFEPSSVTGSLSGDTITLSADENYTGDLVITYSTPAQEGETYTNQAEMDNPGNAPIGDKPSKTVSYNSTTLTKGHWEDRDNKLIKWTIELNINGVDPSVLNDYSIYDEALKNADVTMGISVGSWDDIDSQYYTIDKENGTVTFHDLTSDCGIDYIKIVYYTDPYDGTMNTDEDSYTNTNTAYLKNGDGEEVKSATDEDTWNAVNSIVKTHGESVIDEENGIMIIPWTITIEQEAGKFRGLTLEDIVLSDDKGNIDLHYISPEQLKELTVTNANTGASLDAECYSVTNSDANLTSFNIAFNDVDALDEVTKVIISYETTAVISEVETGQTVVFGNTASFNGKESKDTEPYENVDTSKTPYIKGVYIADTDTIEYETVKKSISDLDTVTIDGTEFYLINYVIAVNTNYTYSGETYTITDSLPEGFTFYGYPDLTNKGQHVAGDSGYLVGWNGYSKYPVNSSTNPKFVLNDSKDTITITSEYKSSLIFYYTVKISKEDLNKKLEDPNYTIINSIKDETYDEVTSEIKIEEDSSILTKSLSANSEKLASGYIEYEIKVNPNGDDLSRDDSLILTDILKAHTYGDGVACDDPGGINIYLDSIDIYQIGAGENGEDVLLDSSEYSYVLDNNPPAVSETKTVSYSDMDYYGNDIIFNFSDVFSNGTNEIVISGPASTAFNYYVGTSVSSDNTILGWSDGYFDSEGHATITIPSDKFDPIVNNNDSFILFIYNGKNNNWELSVESANFAEKTITGNHEYAAKLTLTVPDETPLRIVYRYIGMRPEGSAADDTVGVVNSVSVNTVMQTENTSLDSKFVLSSSSEGTITGKKKITIYKVDTGNYSLKLNASFNLYKWDAENETWLAASELSSDESDSTLNVVSKWGGDTPVALNITKDELFNISLDSGTLYKIVEITAPDGYIQLEEPRYFSIGILSGVSPPEEAENYSIISNGGNLNIQNYKNISVRVDKSWADGNENHENDSVTVELYKSTTNISEGYPSDLELVEGSQVTLSAADNWSHIWSDLPNGTESGLPVYYYVKEVCYTINGDLFTVDSDNSGEFIPYYIGNGLNTSDTVEIVNTAGLTVEKVWHTYNNDDGIPAADYIEFQVYRSTVQQLDGTLPSDAELWKEDNFRLDSSNNWTMVFKDGIEPADADGNPYYYYVVETTNLSDNKVSYLGNGSGSTGLITITNKSTKIVIGEMPETGSIGTAWFFAAGGTLFVIALAALRILRRRLSDKS